MVAKAKRPDPDQPAALPAMLAKSWGEMSRGEKLASNSDLALDVTRKILELGVNPEDVRVLRVVKDTALVIISNSIKVDEGQMRTDDEAQRRQIVLDKLRRELMKPSDPAANAAPARRGKSSNG